VPTPRVGAAAATGQFSAVVVGLRVSLGDLGGPVDVDVGDVGHRFPRFLESTASRRSWIDFPKTDSDLRF
jgi:hypothetical protein